MFTFYTINDIFPYYFNNKQSKGIFMSIDTDHSPSVFYRGANLIMNVALPVASRTPPLGTLTSCFITGVTKGIFDSVVMSPLLSLGRFTFKSMFKIVNKYPILTNKILFLSPVINIGTVTAISYMFFNFTVNPYAKTAIFAIHQSAMGILTIGQKLDKVGTLTVNHSFLGFLNIGKLARSTLALNESRLRFISEIMCCTAFVVSTIGLAYFGFNPIFNSVISAVTASVVKAFSVYVQLVLAPKIDLTAQID